MDPFLPVLLHYVLREVKRAQGGGRPPKEGASSNLSIVASPDEGGMGSPGIQP